MADFKIIENEIKKVMDENKDFYDIYNNLNNLLGEFRKNIYEVNENKINLLNLFFKSYKKVIILDNIKISGRQRGITLGINKEGLGIINYYGINLSRIADEKVYFTKILKLENVKEKLLSLLDNEKQEIIKPFLFLNEKEKEELKINKIELSLLSGVYFYKPKKEDDYYRTEIRFLDKEHLANYDMSQIEYFFMLVDNKEEIIKVLKEKFEEYKIYNEEVKKQIGQVNEVLKPYLALQQI